MEVGQKLRERRLELGMKQDQVAEMLGVTRQTISNWENGKSYPDIDRVVHLSDIYQLSLDQLLKGDQKMVEHYKENTNINKYLKIISILFLVNFLAMIVLLFTSNNSSKFLFTLVFTFFAINTVSIFYLIIKKI